MHATKKNILRRLTHDRYNDNNKRKRKTKMK